MHVTLTKNPGQAFRAIGKRGPRGRQRGTYYRHCDDDRGFADISQRSTDHRNKIAFYFSVSFSSIAVLGTGRFCVPSGDRLVTGQNPSPPDGLCAIAKEV